MPYKLSKGTLKISLKYVNFAAVLSQSPAYR